jgi:hypothetical protein
VLDFSDRTFKTFFVTEIDADIDDPTYAELGKSKGKRLCCFLQKVDDATASRTLRALWNHRLAYLERTGQKDPVHNAEGRYVQILARLSDGLPTALGETPQPAFKTRLYAELQEELAQLAFLPPHERGYAFESFLQQVFESAGLTPREPFSNLGEQIDGSFLLGEETYLLEAKWHDVRTGAADLHVFQGKIGQKAAWARGLFVSYKGFTQDGLTAFGSGTRLICMDGADIELALDRQIPLKAVLERKVRAAAESGRPFVPVADLFK